MAGGDSSRGAEWSCSSRGKLREPEESMSLNRKDFDRGVAYWRRRKWPADFHNAFYREMANRDPHGDFNDDWWADFLLELRRWRATRRRGSDFLTSRARDRFSSLSAAWRDAVQPNLGQDIETVEWSRVSAFPTLVAEIKDVASPVFASKFCHFLAPAIFPLVDNAAMGNPYATYEACFCAYRREWLSTDRSTRELLTGRLARLVGVPLVDGFPLKNKTVELCLIGRCRG